MRLGRPRDLVPLLVAVLAASLFATPAAAQTEEASYALRLVGQPLWHEAGTALDVSVEVTNSSGLDLDGFRVQISSYERVTSRSALVESFDEDPFGSPTVVTFEEFELTIPDGESTTVALTTPLSDLATLASGAGGVYPLGLDLADTGGALLGASVVTELVYYPEEPETSLGIVLVAPLNDLAQRGPDGVFAPDGEDVIPLEAALAEGGWLRGTFDAMEAVADRRPAERLHFGLAPTPRLVEEISDMADGYARADADGDTEEVPADSPPSEAARNALDQLRALLDTKGVQPLLVPYSFPDLPALAHADAGGGVDAIVPQLTTAEEVLGEIGPDAGFTRRWIFPPAGRLDGVTLGELRGLSPETGARTFFSAESLVQPQDAALAGCPEPFLSFACPVSVTGPWGEAQGYQADAGLQQRFIALAEPGEDRLDLQRLLAETAMIREELPGREDRVVQATMPSLWHPRPRLARLLFRSLADAPWLRSLTPNQGLHQTSEAVPRDPVPVIGDLSRAPDETHFQSLEDAEETVSNFSGIGAPDALVTRLSRDILVAYSRSWWSDPDLFATGAAFASAAREEAEDHLARIQILAAPDITMTSRRADLQLIISNDNPYPVRLEVGIESPNLRVDDVALPNEFPPEATTPVQASVAAQTSGIFQVSLTATTPTGYQVDELVVSVRSTELNQVALGLTLGALAFLVSFYVYRGIRRRRRATGDSGAAPA
ncbi:MAG: DUF6049 family protein [Actinomycetota bacterium]|nr:DUF6049 family protein [Actinomycetota bacterium]